MSTSHACLPVTCQRLSSSCQKLPCLLTVASRSKASAGRRPASSSKRQECAQARPWHISSVGLSEQADLAAPVGSKPYCSNTLILCTLCLQSFSQGTVSQLSGIPRPSQLVQRSVRVLCWATFHLFGCPKLDFCLSSARLWYESQLADVWYCGC